MVENRVDRDAAPVRSCRRMSHPRPSCILRLFAIFRLVVVFDNIIISRYSGINFHKKSRFLIGLDLPVADSLDWPVQLLLMVFHLLLTNSSRVKAIDRPFYPSHELKCVYSFSLGLGRQHLMKPISMFLTFFSWTNLKNFFVF